MIFLRLGWPRTLLKYQAILTCVSLASEPELVKNTLEAGTGEMALIFSASAMAGSWLRPPNRCVKDSRDICSRAVSTSSRLP